MKRQLREKFKELGILAIYLFGSKARGRVVHSGDVDIGIVLNDPPADGDSRALYHALYLLFTEIYPGSKLDIVFLQVVPLSLQYSAINEGKVLFKEDPKLTADYEEKVMKLYLDFKPVLDYFDKVAMERYAKT